jgi:hypothetical protein
VLALPLVPLLPLQAPEAVHEVALLDDHVNVELPPLDTLVGLALSVTATVGLGSPELPEPVPGCALTSVVFTAEPQADKPIPKITTSNRKRADNRIRLMELLRASAKYVSMRF